MALIRFVTCASLEGFFFDERYPQLTIDDVILLDELVARGHEVTPLVWDSDEAKAPEGDLILIRSPWDYFEKPEALRAWLELMEAGGFPVENRPRDILWNLDKRYLGELGEKGVPVVPTTYLEAGSVFEMPELFDMAGAKDVIVKPAVGANAWETYLINYSNINALSGNVKALVERQRVMVQPFLEEVLDDGEWSLLFYGGAYSHGFRKLPGPGDFRVQEEHGGSTSVEPIPAAVIAASKAVMAALDFTPLYARVDGIRSGGAFLLMELEMFEPELYFRAGGGAAGRFADVIESRLGL